MPRGTESSIVLDIIESKIKEQNERIKELEEDIRTLILTSDKETIDKLEEKYKYLK